MNCNDAAYKRDQTGQPTDTPAVCFIALIRIVYALIRFFQFVFSCHTHRANARPIATEIPRHSAIEIAIVIQRRTGS